MQRTNLSKDNGFFDIKPNPGKGLSGRFIFPPFSVFRTMDGEWMQRKRQWLALGIESEVGRGGEESNKAMKPQNKLNKFQKTKKPSYGVVYAIGNKTQWEKGLLHKGQTINTKDGEKWEGGRPAWQNTGTSIFDPVLSELMYAWFCPKGGQVVDPFAGGSVRGVVAVYMGMKYWGSELRKEQVEANRGQGKKIAPDYPPEWVQGDAMQELRNAPDADFIFTCPPYGNLEVYSELEGDISNMPYETFRDAYKRIIRRCCHKLKQNRFACFVVANFRDKKTGFYYDLVGDTVKAFEMYGVHLYNEAILITATGSLPVRVGRQFAAGRKLGKTHQNVLIFYKGNPKLIKEIYNEQMEN